MAKSAKIFEAFDIKDSLACIAPKVRDHVANMVLDSAKSGSKVGLLSEIAVTHGGIVNGNFGYYKPEELAQSTKSWTEPYPKPVLKNHDTQTEPLGRNLGSIWRSTVPITTPNFKNSIRSQDFSFRGLGHMQNLVNVSDPEAVQKVLDGRYLTVSVSGETDAMTCSICNQNWLSDGRCEHRFGHEYTDEDTGITQMAYWTGGKFVWDELSFVNEPADPFAVVLNREIEGDAKDSILEVYNYKENTTIDKQVADTSRRMFKLYALNDALKKMVNLDDSTTVDSLYKVYGQRLVQVIEHLDDAKAKIPAKGANLVADNTPVEAPRPEEQPAAPAEAVEAPATEAPVETPAKEVPAETPEVPAPADAAAEAPAEAPAEEVPVEEPAAPGKEEAPKEPEAPMATDSNKPKAEEPKGEDPRIKELAEKNQELTDENRSLVQKISDLQSGIRDEKIAELLDLKQTLGLETYASDDERKVVADEMQKRSLESIVDAITDLRKTKISKQVKPAPVAIKDEHGQSPVQSQLDQIRRTIDSMTPVEIGAMLFGGRYYPRSE
jgi:hypothetical protein